VTKSGAVKFSAAFRLWRARLTHLAASARSARQRNDARGLALDPYLPRLSLILPFSGEAG